MGRSCVVTMCPNKNTTLKPGVRFHKFPKELELCKKWTDFVTAQNGKPYIPKKTSSVCSSHFDANNYDDKMGLPKWKGVPTVQVEVKRFHKTVDCGAVVLSNVGCEVEVLTSNPNPEPPSMSLAKPATFVSEEHPLRVRKVFGPTETNFLDKLPNCSSSTQTENEQQDSHKVQRNLLASFPSTDDPVSRDHPYAAGPHSPAQNLPTPELNVCPHCGKGLGEIPDAHLEINMPKGFTVEEFREMQSLLAQEKRICYPGDITEEDMKSPNRAVRCYHILTNKLRELEKRLATSQQTARRLKEKCVSLQSKLLELQEK